MAVARAQHTATLLPSGEAVLVAGGSAAEDTSELFAADAWSDAGALAVSRRAHVAVAVPGPASVWLLAGAIGAQQEADIAAVFTIGADGVSGTWAPTGALELLGAATAPALNLTGAGAVLLGGHTAVVVGWLGPVCDDQGGPDWSGVACAAENRSYAFDVATPRVTQPVGRDGERHALGAVVATPDGGGFAIGGFEDFVPTASARIEQFTGNVDVATAQPEVATGATLTLGTPRALLAGAAQTDSSVLVCGGLALGDDGLELSDVIEIVNPAR